MLNRIKRIHQTTLYLLLKQFVKFGLVGTVNTILTLTIIYLTVKVMDIHYIIGNGAGYIAGFTNSFILNKIWTFKSRGPVLRESIMFIVIFGICYFVQLMVLMLLIEVLRMDTFISQAVSMVPYTILNFLGNRYITFKNYE